MSIKVINFIIILRIDNLQYPIRAVCIYCELRLVSPELVQLHKGFGLGLLIPVEAYMYIRRGLKAA